MNRGIIEPISGVPWVVLLVLAVLGVWSFLLGRTQVGRYIYAIGGSAEAARRAGINVSAIRTLAFTLTGLTAGIAGIVYASRLRSISTSIDGGTLVLYAVAAAVIGGTSLMGGRGKAIHGVLGGIVIAAIYNGMGLMGYGAAGAVHGHRPRPPGRRDDRRHLAPRPRRRHLTPSRAGPGEWQTAPMATMADLDKLALAMPQATKDVADDGRPSYLVHGKMFCFHRSRRPDAVDPETGERLADVLMFRVPDLEEKELLLSDDRGVYFTTPHFRGYPAVLVRIPRPGPDRPRRAARRRRRRLADRAQKRVAKAWLAENAEDG